MVTVDYCSATNSLKFKFVCIVGIKVKMMFFISIYTILPSQYIDWFVTSNFRKTALML